MFWSFVFNEHISIFPLRKSNVDFCYYLVKEYKYGQYCTPLSQSDCRYFFVLAIKKSIYRKLNLYNLSRELSLNLTIYFKTLQNLTSISTSIDKMIQNNLAFANAISKHMTMKNLHYPFQNVSTESKGLKKTYLKFIKQRSFYQVFLVTQGAKK